MTTDQLSAQDVFAVDFAALAREIACDILPLADVLKLHQLSDAEWETIQRHAKFQQILASMVVEWNATRSVGERLKLKAATGLESVVEIYIRDIADPQIPLAQRVEAGKFLARLGELDGSAQGGGGALGGGFMIQINIGADTAPVVAQTRIIEGSVIPEEAA